MACTVCISSFLWKLPLSQALSITVHKYRYVYLNNPQGSLLQKCARVGNFTLGKKPSPILTPVAPWSQGLDYLHFNGVAHGDIKPDNLLLTISAKVGTGVCLGFSDLGQHFFTIHQRWCPRIGSSVGCCFYCCRNPLLCPTCS